MDIMRVMAYLDLLNGVTVAQRVAMVQAEDTERATEAAEQAARDGWDAQARDAARDTIARRRKARAEQGTEPGDGYPEDWPAGEPQGSEGDGGRSGDNGGPDGDTDGDQGSGPDGDGPHDGGPGRGPGDKGPSGGARGGASGNSGQGACPACGGTGGPGTGLPVRGNLTLPLLTLQGLAERPGEAHGLGGLDPGLVRDLALVGARHPASEFCVTIVDHKGFAVGHGCCKPMRRGTAPPGPAPPGDATRDHATFTPSGRTGPDDGCGSWFLTLPSAPHPFQVTIEPVPTYDCDHRHESTGYQPNGKLRHLVQVRDGACSFPTCSRHARDSDFEHAIPYKNGGRTCACNAHACSRSCHQVKQSPGWSFANLQPGFHQWTTGAGRTYLQGPWQYPN
jgi:hypothetical protein